MMYPKQTLVNDVVYIMTKKVRKGTFHIQKTTCNVMLCMYKEYELYQSSIKQ